MFVIIIFGIIIVVFGLVYPEIFTIVGNAYYPIFYGILPAILKSPIAWGVIAIVLFVQLRKARWIKSFLKTSPHGHSDWASKRQLKKLGMFKPDGLFLGEYQPFNNFFLKHFGRNDLYHHGEGHFITIAAPGGGKSTSLVVPVLLTAKHGSFIVCDPKGELTAITRKHRESCSRVVYLNPFFKDYERNTGLVFPDSGFNPFDAIADDENLRTSTNNLARLLCVTDRGDSNTYFDNDGAVFLSLCIAWIIRYEPPEKQNLSYLYTLVRSDPELLFSAMEHINDPYLSSDAAKFRRMLSNSAGQWQGVVSKAEIATDRYLPTSPLGNHTSKSGFDPRWLKQEDVTVYILMPTKHIQTAAPWLNMVVGVLGDSMGEVEKARSVTFLLDELPALGFLPDLRRQMRQYRGSGLRMWLFSQTVAALASPELYGEHGTEDIFGVCETKQFFNIGELKTATQISELCGQKSEINRNANTKDTDDDFGMSAVGVPLIRPEEILRLDKGKQIIIKSGIPIKANLVPYFTRNEWQRISGKNPYR